MKPQTERAKRAIISSFKDSGFSEQERYDLAFHLTDWVEDLQHVVDFLESPEKYSDEQIRETIIAFVIHAPYHLNHAADILIDGPVQDAPKCKKRRKSK
jgi:hypothetical protein